MKGNEKTWGQCTTGCPGAGASSSGTASNGPSLNVAANFGTAGRGWGKMSGSIGSNTANTATSAGSGKSAGAPAGPNNVFSDYGKAAGITAGLTTNPNAVNGPSNFPNGKMVNGPVANPNGNAVSGPSSISSITANGPQTTATTTPAPPPPPFSANGPKSSSSDGPSVSATAHWSSQTIPSSTKEGVPKRVMDAVRGFNPFRKFLCSLPGVKCGPGGASATLTTPGGAKANNGWPLAGAPSPLGELSGSGKGSGSTPSPPTPASVSAGKGAGAADGKGSGGSGQAGVTFAGKLTVTDKVFRVFRSLMEKLFGENRVSWYLSKELGMDKGDKGQKGMVQQFREKFGTCFPHDAKVIARSGPKTMDEVRIGDELLGFDHETATVGFSKVRAWLHRSSGTRTPVTKIVTDKGQVTSSPTHNFAVETPDTYAFAQDIVVGNKLVTPKGSAIVRSISNDETGEGLYAPLTWTSNYYVSTDDGSESILAHGFAELPKPQMMEKPLHAILSVVEFFYPSIHDVDDNAESSYTHPFARLLAWVAGIRIA
eukprot:gnl/TRDRNA2_/TRDRNA2_173617_c0_seq1.p1 gnl/TRDRNA2_/TRDRNA2_173617_c0~~gnl/TRDRNA2_/TRDRNA2_173617_c0_seq1.p1  ORF type:complete len:608 (+),score=46.18 gnl/TRDRNA2_/TRDRNA2_173617_c0_seq1:203-1825(+)